MGFLIRFYESSHNASVPEALRWRVSIYWYNFQLMRSCNYEMYYWESIISNVGLRSTDVGLKSAIISLTCSPENPLLTWDAVATASTIVTAAAGVCGLFTSCELLQWLLFSRFFFLFLNQAAKWMQWGKRLRLGKLWVRRLSPSWNSAEDWSLWLLSPWEDLYRCAAFAKLSLHSNATLWTCSLYNLHKLKSNPVFTLAWQFFFFNLTFHIRGFFNASNFFFLQISNKDGP